MKFTLTLAFFFLLATVFGQPRFYGVSDYKGGSVFEFDAAANSLTTAYKHQLHEVFPEGSLSLAPNGLMYGTTKSGGGEGTGAIFLYNAAGKEYTLLYNFDQSNGSRPTGELACGGDGKMYGLTTYGGAANNGVIFSFDPHTKAFEKLHDFDGTSGANPVGGLYIDAGGTMYGITQLGGNSGEGVLFSYDPAERIFKKHFDFDPAKGAYPCTGLVKAKDGKLYGATATGGPEEWFSGSIYRFDQKKGTVTHLFYFNWETDEGYGPVSKLTPMPDGKLYGVGQSGGSNYAGVIFSFDPAKKAYAKLYDFSDAFGSTPAGHLVAGTDGILYGTTNEGNSYGYGGVFSYDPANKTFKNLHALQYADGINPAGAVCMGAGGLLYALAPFGGGPEYGTLFSVNPKTGAFAKLKEWDEAPDGAYPQAGLARHANGFMYGSTVGGGHLGKGVIYAYKPASKQYEVAYRFGAADGQYMSGAFLPGKDGHLYGLLNGGGTAGAGQLFSFDPQSGAVQTLYNFEQLTGANPDGSLLHGDDGKFYGVASGGGQGGYGVIFSFNPATSQYAHLLHFDGAGGSLPMDGFAKSGDGKLYGVTQWGGAFDKGVLYVFDPAVGKATKLFEFSGADGAYPLQGVAISNDGKLWGTTPSGGAHDAGVLYSFDPKIGKYTVLFHFDDANGANPQGRLSMGSDGLLYGFARRGGINNEGVVFSFNPKSGIYSKLKDFSGSGSSGPSGSGPSEYCIATQTFYRDRDGDGFGNSAQTLEACGAPAGYTSLGTDCNDADETIYPNAPEICGNGTDDNCNGQTDETCTQTPVLIVKDMIVTETQGEAIVEINLTRPAPKGVKVHFSTYSGTALAGWDFGMTAGLLNFDASNTKAFVKIKIMQDKIRESDEQFRLFFWKPKELSLKQNAAVITIRDSNRPFKGSAAARKAESQILLREAGGIGLTAYPNPAQHQFTLLPSATGKGTLSGLVLDASGKVVEVLRGLQPARPFVLGAGYAPGVYLVRLTQEGKIAYLKLIKLP